MLFTNDFQWFSTTGGVRERRGDLAKQQPLYATLKKMIYNPTAEIMILFLTMSVHLHTNNAISRYTYGNCSSDKFSIKANLVFFRIAKTL